MSVASDHGSKRASRNPFGTVRPYGGDPILSLFEDFIADPRAGKVNLGIGIYMDEDGRIPVLGSVRTAHERLGFGPRPYLPMQGDEGCRRAIQRLVFGDDHPMSAAGAIATIQSIGGSGALGVAADFLAEHRPDGAVYVSDPGWENHHAIFRRAGLATTSYPYWDEETGTIAFDRMLACLEAAAAGSIIVIQPVCHNPTGLGFSFEQETTLTELLLRKEHLVVFDLAYQGFGVGIDEDAGFVRRYAARAPCLVANSFSKTFSLYGERCGGLSIVCRDADEAGRVLGQLKRAVRGYYSNPPTTAGRLVAEVLTDPALRSSWGGEVAVMRNRMLAMRTALTKRLAKHSVKRLARTLVAQQGMFAFSGLSPEAVRGLRAQHGIYLVESGRLCVAGLTPSNLDDVARHIASMCAKD